MLTGEKLTREKLNGEKLTHVLAGPEESSAVFGLNKRKATVVWNLIF